VDRVHRIILDTDLSMGVPGSNVDDGLALALAVAHPEISLELVTTVHGNTDVETATRLTTDLLAVLQRPDLRVVRGAGSAGAAPSAAAEAIVELVMGSPGGITLVPIGPLTNIAAALTREPRVAGAVREVVLMGGSYFGTGNRRGLPGEFNVWSDPEAASQVFSCGAPVRAVGLDVTLQVRLTREDTAALRRSGRTFGVLAADAADAWIGYLDAQDRLEHRGTCPLHDPLALVAVLRPDLFTWLGARLTVSGSDTAQRGAVTVDVMSGSEGEAARCCVASAVDAAGAKQAVVRTIGAL